MVRTRQIIAVAGLVTLLAGCTGTPGFPILDREPTAADAPPDDLAELSLDDFDVDSLRYAGEYEGIGLYVIATAAGAPCLFVADGAGSSIACGGTGWVMTEAYSGYTFELGPAPIVGGDGWTIVSENIRARPSD